MRNLRYQAIGDAVTERHECKSDEGRDGISYVLPIDVADLAYHQTSDLWHHISPPVVKAIFSAEPHQN